MIHALEDNLYLFLFFFLLSIQGGDTSRHYPRNRDQEYTRRERQLYTLYAELPEVRRRQYTIERSSRLVYNFSFSTMLSLSGMPARDVGLYVMSDEKPTSFSTQFPATHASHRNLPYRCTTLCKAVIDIYIVTRTPYQFRKKKSTSIHIIRYESRG